MNFSAAIGCLLLSAPAWANGHIIECAHERYYEGDKVACVLRLDLLKGPVPELAHVSWRVFDKELKKETIQLSPVYKVLPSISWEAPSGLRAVIPLDLNIVLTKRNSNEAIAADTEQVRIYPRPASFYLDPKSIADKRIAVDDSTGKLKKELDYLKIPYDSVRMADMPPKRYDLFILARTTRTAEPVILGNGTRVIQLDVDVHLDDDPQTRWLLAQRIRAVFKSENDAKDLATNRSNP